MSLKPGIHLLHKPVGVTSFSLVREVMEEIAATGKKLPVCHGGTLDPFAEGLVLLLAGQATRLMDLMHPIPKVYEAELRWGVETDNGDPGGKVVFEGDPANVTRERLEAELQTFLGWQEQIPPATSAKKIGGEPAYRKVHRGEEVVLPPSRVYLHSARWLSHELPAKSTVELVCKGGYYVRSFARDLGRRLGCGAHVSALRRTAIGPWRDPAPGERVWIHGRDILSWRPSRALSEQEFDAIRQGQSIAAGRIDPPDWPLPEGFPDPGGPIRGLNRDRLVALLKEEDGRLASYANLRGGL